MTWKRGSEEKAVRNREMLRERELDHPSYRTLGQMFGVSKERARKIVRRERRRQGV